MTAAAGAMEPAALPLARALASWFARPPPALRFGLKLATALTLSIWIAFASALPWGLTIWIAVLFVAQPNAEASIQKGLMRVAGAVAAGLVSIAIYGLFAQQPPLFLASLCTVLGVSIYGATGTRFPYAWLVLGFTTILILVKSMAGIDEIETLAFERASLDALGLLILSVADAIFWPVRAEKELRERLAQRAREVGDALRQRLASEPSDPAGSRGAANSPWPAPDQDINAETTVIRIRFLFKDLGATQ